MFGINKEKELNEATMRFTSGFTASVRETLKHEGGDTYTDNPNDNGGCTKYGISLRCYKENVNPSADCTTIKSLTESEAVDLYYKYFWLEYKIDDLINITIKSKVFDTCVNCGRGGIKILQRAINQYDSYINPITEDGYIGSITSNSVNNILKYQSIHYFIELLVSKQKSYYMNIINNNSSQSIFANGWNKRAEYRGITNVLNK